MLLILGGASTMRINLFSKGDSVLLLGEGNFSFSVALLKHQLPIKIVATCFQSELQFQFQKENIEYLKSNNVPVFLNVDATKLHENFNFPNVKFSKIVFNFPHVGGKMKIHLNRELLRKVFESCSRLIESNGAVLVSLCGGQGGTPADEPLRRWADTWQITEMAAHGDFVLTGVEPFVPGNFPGYKCVGYRGNDVRFRLTGALVHIFHKREPPCPHLNESLATKTLNLVPLSQGSNVLVPSIYAELYQSSPLGNPNSHISFFERFLVENLNKFSPDSVWSRLKNDDVPVHASNGTGVFCQVDSVKRCLRSSPSVVLPNLLQLYTHLDSEKKRLLFSGMYFNPLGVDFLGSPPLEFRFVILGDNLSVELEKILKSLIDLFKATNVRLSRRVSEKDLIEGVSLIFSVGFSYEDPKAGTRCPAVLVYEGLGLEIAIVNAQLICQYFFEIGWREIWADKVEVGEDGRPSSRPMSLYPSSYEFDVTLRGLCEDERVCEVIWLAVGRLVEGVSLVNEYTSAEGWSSKCYRITYKSLEKPLHRSRVLGLHSAVVCRALELGLNVRVV